MRPACVSASRPGLPVSFLNAAAQAVSEGIPSCDRHDGCGVQAVTQRTPEQLAKREVNRNLSSITPIALGQRPNWSGSNLPFNGWIP
jgi:hypothetical protein